MRCKKCIGFEKQFTSLKGINAMKKGFSYGLTIGVLLAVLMMSAPAAWAQYWVSFDDNSRYLALGDSLSAGYGAHPATNGFVYQLYQSGAIDNINNTLLNNIGVVNATSADVLAHQLPLGALFFSNTGADYRKVVTITVGGDDFQAIIPSFIDPSLTQEEKEQLVYNTLTVFSANLGAILANLSAFPDVHIYVANQFDPQLPIPGETDVINALNEAIGIVVSNFPLATIVDVFSAFEGKKGLLLIEKKGGDPFQVHPTNAGYRVITKAFIDAIHEANE
jgi:lysophospholipase L1-like esterase